MGEAGGDEALADGVEEVESFVEGGGGLDDEDGAEGFFLDDFVIRVVGEDDGGREEGAAVHEVRIGGMRGDEAQA